MDLRCKVPRWLDVITLVSVLPVFSLPSLLSACPAGNEGALTLLRIYPVYVIITAWLARLSWRERPYVTWILIVLLWLTHAAAWLLVYNL